MNICSTTKCTVYINIKEKLKNPLFICFDFKTFSARPPKIISKQKLFYCNCMHKQHYL